MTTETTTPAERAKQISDRLLEIAPYPERGEDVTALDLARYLGVRGAVICQQQLGTAAPHSHQQIDLMTILLAASHALFAAHDRDRAHADLAAREIWGAWESGDGVGELLWRHLGAEAWCEVALLADELAKLESAEASEDLAKLRNACKHMGSVIVSVSRQMECARIEMLQNGPERAMQWILNGLPDVDDNPPGMRWDGRESADEWFERTADYARSEAAK